MTATFYPSFLFGLYTLRLKQELEGKLHERNKLIEEWKAEQEEKEHALQRYDRFVL